MDLECNTTPARGQKEWPVTQAPDDLGIDLMSGTFYEREPYDAYAWMRANAPVYYDEPNDLWAVASYAGVKAASVDTDSFSNAGGIRPKNGPLPMMIDFDAPEHVRRRRLVSEGFTPRRVRAMEDDLRAQCDAIIDEVCEKGSCDLVRDIASPLPIIVIGNLLGVAPTDRDDLLRWSDDMLKALGSPDPSLMEGAANAFVEYTAYIHPVFEDRRRRGSVDDLVGVLCHATIDGDSLDDDSLVHETLLILIGGDETTRHVISGGTAELLAHPDQAQRLAADPELMTGAVEEMLRWVSPIKNMARTTTHDVELEGTTIPAGQGAAAPLSLGQPGRHRLRRPGHLRHHPLAQPPPGLRLRRPLLPGQPAGPAGAQGDDRATPGAPPRSSPDQRAGHPAPARRQLHLGTRGDAGRLHPHGAQRGGRRLSEPARTTGRHRCPREVLADNCARYPPLCHTRSLRSGP